MDQIEWAQVVEDLVGEKHLEMMFHGKKVIPVFSNADTVSVYTKTQRA